ncbi:hypothetical protein CEE45_01300 [Candidatus Heimdallarchaeota archaeon B3_Heim]|nr:MAG: hypothetical protein CEE45_01300 [Candidatus Heimdallarchaeota archaeon B3_Heim]
MTDHKNIEEFISWLRKNNKSIILAMHNQADPDAVGSAIALIHLIKYVNPQIEVSVYDPDLSGLSQKLLLHLDYELPIVSEYDISTLLILLDNPSIPLKLNQPERKIIIIDHHVKQEIKTKLLFDIRKRKVTSTAEIIVLIYQIGNIPLNAISVKSLLAGIIFDTRRFLYVKNELFNKIVYLLQDYPTAYRELLPLFTSTRSFDERIACIKAAQRMKRVEIKKFQIVLSHVSSFEAAAARSLIYLGGDLSIVVARLSDHSRISLRATSEFTKSTNISLGRDIVPLLIDKFEGTGGGHDGAAGYNSSTRMDLKLVFDFLLHNLTDLIKKNQEN